jgi:hypothetical protein
MAVKTMAAKRDASKGLLLFGQWDNAKPDEMLAGFGDDPRPPGA